VEVLVSLPADATGADALCMWWLACCRMREYVSLIQDCLHILEDTTTYVPAALAKAAYAPGDLLRRKVRACRAGHCTAQAGTEVNCAAQHVTSRHSTAWHNTAEHRIVLHSTGLHSYSPRSSAVAVQLSTTHSIMLQQEGYTQFTASAAVARAALTIFWSVLCTLYLCTRWSSVPCHRRQLQRRRWFRMSNNQEQALYGSAFFIVNVCPCVAAAAAPHAWAQLHVHG
jgi:hypothetical protein